MISEARRSPSRRRLAPGPDIRRSVAGAQSGARRQTSLNMIVHPSQPFKPASPAAPRRLPALTQPGGLGRERCDAAARKALSPAVRAPGLQPAAQARIGQLKKPLFARGRWVSEIFGGFRRFSSGNRPTFQRPGAAGPHRHGWQGRGGAQSCPPPPGAAPAPPTEI